MLKSFIYFIALIIRQKDLIISMANREVANHYVGSLLGFIWTFVNPIVMISVFWFVFEVGFKIQTKSDVPFVAWLTAGMAIWFVFADIISGSTGVIVENASLIKKTIFPSQILPIIKIVSCLITHSVFLIILITLIFLQGMPFNFYYIQFLYYLFCMVVLALGISWIASALNVFIRDMKQIIALLVQIGFWATPIFWNIGIMPENIQNILKLNPLQYIVQGYRESFIYFLPFWRHPYQTLYFWLFSLTLLFCGALVFKRLKPQFADVL